MDATVLVLVLRPNFTRVVMCWRASTAETGLSNRDAKGGRTFSAFRYLRTAGV